MLLERTHAERLWNVASAVLLVTALGSMLQTLRTALHAPLSFDDAYMFARYAAHMRQGLGMSWNLDGVPTYGPTSLLWVLVVWGLSFLSMDVWTGLALGSWVCALGALVAMAWAVAANAQTAMLRSVWRVLPLVAVPLVGTQVFGGNAGTGMETMLAVLLGATFLGMALLWSRGSVRAEWVGVVGFLLFLARPESGVVVVLLPVLVFFLKPEGAISKRALITLLGLFGLGVGLDLLGCRLYFHTALPLSFYMKGHHAYAGFEGIFHPEFSMIEILAACQLYLAAMILLTRQMEWRLVACCAVPAFAVFAYLQTVTQIMGFHARYYVPYLAYLVVPALLVGERWWVGRREPLSLVRGCVAVAMVVGFLVLSSEVVKQKIRHIEGISRFVYDPPSLAIAANRPLPNEFWEGPMLEVTDLLVAPLPKGVKVASTEVGYLGSKAAQDTVIDMAGLNDTEIALHGFDVKRLLDQKPDLIWMPHTGYTYMRGELLSDPALLAQYDVYAGAAVFGLAVRRDSPYRAALERQMEIYWQAVYPDRDMEQYRVLSSSWTGKGHLVSDE